MPQHRHTPCFLRYCHELGCDDCVTLQIGEACPADATPRLQAVNGRGTGTDTPSTYAFDIIRFLSTYII